MIVEAFRPGVMAKFGLSYDQVKAVNPNVIYLSVTGFGQSGPNSNRPVTDAVIGLLGPDDGRHDKDGIPQRLNMIPIDVTTGLYAFHALSTALMRKFRYGTGCYIDNNLMQSAAAFGGKGDGVLSGKGPEPAALRPRGHHADHRRLHQHHRDAGGALQTLCDVMSRQAGMEG